MIKLFCTRCKKSRWHTFSLLCRLCGSKNSLPQHAAIKPEGGKVVSSNSSDSRNDQRAS